MIHICFWYEVLLKCYVIKFRKGKAISIMIIHDLSENGAHIKGCNECFVLQNTSLSTKDSVILA